MTNPTTPFSWQMPTATDLVTDLPADFETFGQAVATSMADLLGGTTGQILSKASATDMDFTWITNDVGDITAVTAGTGISGGGTSGAVTVTNAMATAMTTKGDLVPATGSGTFARLAAGTNGFVLSANSTTATGLEWIANEIGDITAVTAGSGLSGGGTTGAVSLALDLASANVFTAAQTATSFIVTGSTIPANGIYLSAANTLAFSTNSTARMFIDSAGNFGVGGAAQAGRTMTVTKQMTGSTVGYTFTGQSEIASDVTSVARIFRSGVSTQASVFTLNALQHFFVSNFTQGAGSIVTAQTGYHCEPLSGAGTNTSFLANSTAATNSWNFYAAGTAPNYLAGQTTVGSISLVLGAGSVAQQFGVVSSAATNIVEVVRGAASQTGDLVQWQNSAGTKLTTVTSAGAINFHTGNTASTATAGAVTAPALVVGYITMQIAGTTVKVPYYAN